MQIIVLGMHRAGTSLATRLINMMGAYFAPEGLSLGFNADNPKGFWERKDVMRVNDTLLSHFGATWDKPVTWNEEQLATIPTAITNAIRGIVLEMDAHRPFVLKDPRLCITLPCWLEWLEVPTLVIAARNPVASARSLQTRNNITVKYGLALWEFYAVHTIKNTYSLPKIFTRYEHTIKDPTGAVQQLYTHLTKAGVQDLRMPSRREIEAFVSPTLQHEDSKVEGIELSEFQQQLFAMLCGEEEFDPTVELSAEARYVLTSQQHISNTP